jgi:aryl-alcohol dehydrogenase
MICICAGGVGLSAVMAAKVAACSQVIVVDINASRLDFAKSLGATHTVLLNKDDKPADIAKVDTFLLVSLCDSVVYSCG